MFVYERDGAICVTFKDNKPVETPEYSIVINKEAGTLAVNGTVIEVTAAEENVSTDIEEDVTEPETTEVVNEPTDEEESDEEV